MTEFEFKKGAKIEVSIEEEGFRGAWFSGTIMTPPSKKSRKTLVEYDALLDENGVKPLKETVDLIQIRPIPPREDDKDIIFNVDDDVDAFYNDGWWEGVVTRVDFQNNDDHHHLRRVYSVYFRPTSEQCDFSGSDLRLHREWLGSSWLPPLELINGEAGSSGGIIHGEEVNPISKGTQVEVSSDEEGFEGAWFGASVIEVLGKDKFLIQYNDLTDDDSQLVKEEVDALHIRPCPPTAEKVDKFKQYDEVDALYNDGWWVGIVSKVLARSKYKVYFKTTGEEMEFKHDKLRLHRDWVNGKWVAASKALNLSS